MSNFKFDLVEKSEKKRFNLWTVRYDVSIKDITKHTALKNINLRSGLLHIMRRLKEKFSAGQLEPYKAQAKLTLINKSQSAILFKVSYDDIDQMNFLYVCR